MNKVKGVFLALLVTAGIILAGVFAIVAAPVLSILFGIILIVALAIMIGVVTYQEYVEVKALKKIKDGS